MKKLIVYILIIATSGYIVREIIYAGLRKSKSGIFNKYNEIFINKNNYETIIIGSSRAETHYNCRMLDSALQTNSYNIGIQGGSLLFSLDVFNAYLENSSFPKNVILNIDSYVSKCDYDTIYMFSRFFPYLQNKTLYQALEVRDNRFFSFKYLPYYGLAYLGDANLGNAFRGFFNKPGIYDLSYYKGYTPIMELNMIPQSQWKYREQTACNEKLFYDKINNFIKRCKKEGSNLFLVISPTYYKTTNSIVNRENINQKISSLASINSILFLDYSQDELNRDSTLFADPHHLKEKGAKLFTNKLIADLETYWKSRK